MPETLDDIIKDEGVQLYRPALEGVQFAGHDWKITARSAKSWGYSGVQLSHFHLPPKEIVETDLAEQVSTYFLSLGNAEDEMPFKLAGYSTHCAMTAWGFAQHPGSLLFVPEDKREELYGKPAEIRAWMWENVVQYIPAATAKLGLMGTHTFIPPAVVGDIPGVEFAGAHIPGYTFVMNHGVPIRRGEKLVTVNLWEEAVKQQGTRLKPLFDQFESSGTFAAHEMHYDTIARGPTEYLQVLKMLGPQAEKVMFLGFDNSHAWQGESRREWIDKVGGRIRWLHIKNMVTQSGRPLITGDANWLERGMHFSADDEGDMSIGEQLNYIAAHSDFVFHPTYQNEKPVGSINGRPVFTKFAIAEGEHPMMTQVSVARGYAGALRRACGRKYDEGFNVGGTKG